MESTDMYIPNYMSFNNDNIFLGSYGKLRFKLSPNVQEQTIRAEYWFGPLCYEKSTMDGERTFPMTEEDILDMKQWLLKLHETGHPLPAEDAQGDEQP